MSPSGTTLVLLALYGAGVAAAALFARGIGRAIPVRLLLLFAALPVVFLRPGVLENRAPLGPDQAFLTLPGARPEGARASAWLDDVVHQILPWHVAVRRAWKSGSLPLRNPWNGCGTVLDANGQSAAFSPMTAMGFLAPPLSALSLWGALRLFLCLAGAWLWLTELSISGRAALFGAVAFGFSMTMTAWIFFPMTAAVCLWPWALLLVERLAAEDGRRRAFAGLVAVLTLWPLSGHVETAASAAAFTALFLLVRTIAGDGARVRRLLPPAAAASVLALGLSAFSLVPQALAIRASNRLALVAQPFWTPILSLAPHGTGWKNGALTVLFPRLFGDNFEIPAIPGAAGAFPEMVLGYAGILTAALALLIARPGSPRPAGEKALAAAALFGLGAAVGLWPFAEIVSKTPAISHMFPLRYLTWFALAAAAVASFELDRLTRDAERRRDAGVWAIAALAGVLLFAYGTWRRARGLYVAAGALDPGRQAFLLAGLALAAGILVLASTSTVRRGTRLAAFGIPLLALVTGVELFVQGTRLYRWSDPGALFPVTPLVDFLRRQPRPFRVAGEGAMLFPNVNVLAGVEEVRTHDATERRDYVEFLDAAAGYAPSEYFKQLRDLDAPVLDFLNARFLVAFPGRTAPSPKWKPVYSGADGAVFENENVLPRIFAPERVRRMPGAPRRELLRGLDWRREAILRGDDIPAGEPPAANGPAEISDYSETPNAIAFRARVPESAAGTILATSLVGDGGWRARDESGRTIPIERVNGPFLGLRVPAGDHRVRLSYAPPGFRSGSLLSAISVGVCLVALARSRRRRSLTPPARPGSAPASGR